MFEIDSRTNYGYVTLAPEITPTPEDDSNDLLTVREVAKHLRVDDSTVRRWIKNGVLEALTLPHRGTRMAYRIKRSVLRRQMPNSGF